MSQQKTVVKKLKNNRMAIILETRNAEELSDEILQRIVCKDIRTWIIDDDGDFTSANSIWGYRAWLRMNVEDNRIVFGIISSKRFLMTKELYGVYHGRFAAMLLAYFDDHIQHLTLTPNADDNYDII